jgi:choline dehydrogenase-like flavoprotein
MLSGIGNSDELKHHRIEVVLDRSSVGANLREHPLVQMDYRSKVPSYNLTGGLFQKLSIATKYLCFREGPISAAYESVALLKTTPTAAHPEVQIAFAPIGFRGAAEGTLELTPYPGIKFIVLKSHPVSSGRVRLASADAVDAPLIECQLLQSEADVETLVRGIEIVRRIMAAEPIASLIETETAPGGEIESAHALREYVRGHTSTTCQPIGTCRMGLGSTAVVEPSLRVRGIENLWIADASIMPDHASANFNAVCMMVGTKLGKQLVAERR